MWQFAGLGNSLHSSSSHLGSSKNLLGHTWAKAAPLWAPQENLHGATTHSHSSSDRPPLWATSGISHSRAFSSWICLMGSPVLKVTNQLEESLFLSRLSASGFQLRICSNNSAALPTGSKRFQDYRSHCLRGLTYLLSIWCRSKILLVLPPKTKRL